MTLTSPLRPEEEEAEEEGEEDPCIKRSTSVPSDVNIRSSQSRLPPGDTRVWPWEPFSPLGLTDSFDFILHPGGFKFYNLVLSTSCQCYQTWWRKSSDTLFFFLIIFAFGLNWNCPQMFLMKKNSPLFFSLLRMCMQRRSGCLIFPLWKFILTSLSIHNFRFQHELNIYLRYFLFYSGNASYICHSLWNKLVIKLLS